MEDITLGSRVVDAFSFLWTFHVHQWLLYHDDPLLSSQFQKMFMDLGALSGFFEDQDDSRGTRVLKALGAVLTRPWV